MPKIAAIRFDVGQADALIITAIARRAMVLAARDGSGYALQDAQMDITACHCNGCPLKLGDLLQADDFNFAHDVFGIRRNLDRDSGQLGDCFLPRFSQDAHDA